jgi:hypothetical protein
MFWVLEIYSFGRATYARRPSFERALSVHGSSGPEKPQHWGRQNRFMRRKNQMTRKTEF